MVRIGPSGIVGLLAVALVAHSWMFPSFVDMPTASPAPAAAIQASDDALPAGCPSGMSRCIGVDTDRVLLLFVVALSTVPWLLLPAAIGVADRRRSSRRGPPPLLTPVTERVVLLE